MRSESGLPEKREGEKEIFLWSFSQNTSGKTPLAGKTYDIHSLHN
jgi:hypothetical protein